MAFQTSYTKSFIKPMNVINIIDRLDYVNYGIWNSAISTVRILLEKYGIQSYLLYSTGELNEIINKNTLLKIKLIDETLPSYITSPEDTIIVSHGCWRQPTRLAYHLFKKGYKWVYSPHGMLENWSMKQKWLRKKIYYEIIEKPLSKNANIVRAVSLPEMINLKKVYSNVVLIPNGHQTIEFVQKNWNDKPWKFVFLGRLHFKKGVVPLIRAWKKSTLNNNHEYELIIAGPDDGELKKVLDEIYDGKTKNITYVGQLYDREKAELLKNSHFFILPSFSEGFPTTIIEAIQYGNIAVISEGCNFPEAIENKIVFEVESNETNIQNVLERIIKISTEELEKKSIKAYEFISKNYSLEKIAEKQYSLYKNLLDL